MKFINSNVRIVWVDPYKEIFHVSLAHLPLASPHAHPSALYRAQDLDGSLSNQTDGGWVAAYYKYNDWPECPRDRVGTFNFGTVCPANVIIRKISHDLNLPTQLTWQNMCVVLRISRELQSPPF